MTVINSDGLTTGLHRAWRQASREKIERRWREVGEPASPNIGFEFLASQSLGIRVCGAPVNMHFQFIVRLFFAVAATLLIVAIFMSVGNRAPVRVVAATRALNSSHVTLQVCKNAPDRVRLYAVRLWTKVGTNWALRGMVQLNDTNCTVRNLNTEVDFPALPRPWKASLAYIPAFSRVKLLGYQLREAWNTKSLKSGFMTEGWEGVRYTDSPEISQ